MDNNSLVERAPLTLSERMRAVGAGAMDRRLALELADEVEALETRIDKMELWIGRAMEELSATDILKKNYEKLGLSSALVVNNKYGKHSAFGYMGRK